jgi:hypothetical protein
VITIYPEKLVRQVGLKNTFNALLFTINFKAKMLIVRLYYFPMLFLRDIAGGKYDFKKTWALIVGIKETATVLFTVNCDCRSDRKNGLVSKYLLACNNQFGLKACVGEAPVYLPYQKGKKIGCQRRPYLQVTCKFRSDSKSG